MNVRSESRGLKAWCTIMTCSFSLPLNHTIIRTPFPCLAQTYTRARTHLHACLYAHVHTYSVQDRAEIGVFDSKIQDGHEDSEVIEIEDVSSNVPAGQRGGRKEGKGKDRKDKEPGQSELVMSHPSNVRCVLPVLPVSSLCFFVCISSLFIVFLYPCLWPPHCNLISVSLASRLHPHIRISCFFIGSCTLSMGGKGCIENNSPSC